MDACRHPTLRHSDYNDSHLLRRKEGLSDVKTYPGFIEAHAHGVFAGYRAIRQANLAQVGLKADYAKYREIIKENSDSSRAVTAMALAQQSGFHSYSTFSNAFKKHTGTTVTEWMKG
jgi:AraC-like DNA-binding protein